MPRTDYIDISSNKSSSIQNHSINTTTLPSHKHHPRYNPCSHNPLPTISQTIPTQGIDVSSLAPRALVLSTPPSSPIEPHPYLTTLDDLSPRKSNPPPPSDLIGVDHWYSQQRWFEPYQFSIRHVFRSTMCKRTDNPPLLPPIVRTMPGRPRKNKVKAQSENNSQVNRDERTSSKPPDYATYASVRGGGRVSRGGISGRGEGSGGIGQTSSGMGRSSDGRGQRVGGRGQRGGGKSQIGGARGQRGGLWIWVEKCVKRSDEQRNLYKALVDAYEADKTILESYRESAILKRRREDDDDQEGPSAGSDRGSKRRREGGEHASVSTPSEQATGSAGRSTTGIQSRQLSTSESAFAEEPVQTTCQMEEPLHLPRRPPTPDRDWSKTLPTAQGNAQSWISKLARQTDARSSFNELLDTPIDFSNFIMNRLNVDTLTLELVAGPTFKLMRRSCNSLTELEYHLEEVYKAMTDQLDWVNPEGQQYPHNLLQPLPLIPDNQGRCVIPFAHLINNDLEYLRGGASIRKYTTSVIKTKAADYGLIKWIEDLVPRTMWIQEPLNYDKYALWGVSHWGRKRQQFYGYAVNRESALDVYSKRRIIAVIELKIMEWHNYKHLNWILRRGDKDRAAAMIQAIDKMLKIRRIMRSLEKFVGGRL
nr:zinc finger, PMZ-type [Tanacetum cinerariifolium]